jgi:EpsI family protein
VQVVNPQTQELLDKLYSQILTRTYVNAGGYRVMLSLAYGNDQRGSLQAHKPEVCYPAQGFQVSNVETANLKTGFGTIPVRRLFGTLGARQEPVTYWFTVGDKAVMGTTQKKLVELRFGLTGRIPDGMLFRVSSIDADQGKAYQAQEQFVNQLLQAVAPADRKRLSGLDETGAHKDRFCRPHTICGLPCRRIKICNKDGLNCRACMLCRPVVVGSNWSVFNDFGHRRRRIHRREFRAGLARKATSRFLISTSSRTPAIRRISPVCAAIRVTCLCRATSAISNSFPFCWPHTGRARW